jgi:predicted kinase
MKTFKQFIDESINDKGALKAIFLAGTPGAGKSYTASKISGGIEPRVVNTDKMLEFLAKKNNVSLKHDGTENSDSQYRELVDKSKHLTKSQLVQYINSMNPLIIDGTSSNINNLVQRVGMLEFFGYDVGMVWVDTDFDTAVSRVMQRDRTVPVEVIEKVYQQAEENKEYYKSKFDFFVEIKNGHGELTNEALMGAFKAAQSFYTGEVNNPIGRRNLEKLKDSNSGYMSPILYDIEEIQKRVSLWYRK